jgi:hypothetical protein
VLNSYDPGPKCLELNSIIPVQLRRRIIALSHTHHCNIGLNVMCSQNPIETRLKKKRKEKEKKRECQFLNTYIKLHISHLITVCLPCFGLISHDTCSSRDGKLSYFGTENHASVQFYGNKIHL